MSDYQPHTPRPARDFDALRNEARTLREQKRDQAFDGFSLDAPPTNGDEERFEHIGFPGFASFTKALVHDAQGLVDPSSLRCQKFGHLCRRSRIVEVIVPVLNSYR